MKNPQPPQPSKPKRPLTLREKIRQQVANDPITLRDLETLRQKGWLK